VDTLNCMLPPEVYLLDRLIKEILDQFSQLISLEAVKAFINPHKHLMHQEHHLFSFLQTLKFDFDSFVAAKKVEIADKHRVAAAMRAVGRRAEKSAEQAAQNTADLTEEGGNSDVMAEPAERETEAAGPSHNMDMDP
jgi:hypothetical protein